uniref:Uncharacterized protein n=1 Tax=Rhizophora mucronata TaxID=61149 RepID=A0A2P2NEU7_RHIMU
MLSKWITNEEVVRNTSKSFNTRLNQ